MLVLSLIKTLAVTLVILFTGDHGAKTYNIKVRISLDKPYEITYSIPVRLANKFFLTESGSIFTGTAVGNELIIADHVEIHGSSPAVMLCFHSDAYVVDTFYRLGGRGRTTGIAGI